MRRVSWEGGPSTRGESEVGQGGRTTRSERSARAGARDTRGQSSVLAVVLLVGLVAIGMFSIALAGSVTLERTQDMAQNQRTEMVFVEFSQSVTSVALGQGSGERVAFDIRSNHAAVRHDATGHITVYTDDTVIANRTFGSVEYTRDGTTVAYQGGGVWRGTGADATMISPPPFDYEDGSFNAWLPIVTGERTLTSSALTVRRDGSGHALNSQSIVQGQLVTVEIQSKYYGGWADYLRETTNEIAVSVDPENQTVVARLGQPIVDSTFSEGIYAGGGDIQFDGGNAGIDGDVAAEGNVSDHSRVSGNVTEGASGNYRLLDDVIATKIGEAENDTTMPRMNPEYGGALLAGGETYYDSDGFTLDSGETLTVDLSAGNVTMIVNGSISLDGGDIDIQNAGGNRAFRVYSAGDFGMRNSEVGVEDQAQYFQMYGTSEMQIAVTGGNTQLYGTVYAPRDEPVLADDEYNDAALSADEKCQGWDTCVVAGNSDVMGAIVGGPTKIGQSTQFQYDENLRTLQPSLQLDHGLYPPPITYLHLSVYNISVSQEGNSLAPPPVAAHAPADAVGTGASPSLAAEPRRRVAV